MAGVCLNIAIVMGRIVADPQVYTEGVKRATFTLAVDSVWKDKDGHTAKQVSFIDILCWAGAATLAEKFLRKAAVVLVLGRIEVSKFEGNDGKMKKKTTVVANKIRFVQGPPRGHERFDLVQEKTALTMMLDALNADDTEDPQNE